MQEYLARDRRLLTLKLEGEYTAFHLACQFASPELTENLLKMLESKNLLDKLSAKPDGFNPIHLNTLIQRALEQGSRYPFTPALLLKLEADLEQAEDGSGNSLLQRFAIQGNLEAVQWLIKQGVDVNSRSRNLEGNTPLALSILHGHTAITDYLLQSGANIEALGEQQKSPLYLAVERKESKESQDLIELLLSKGADPKFCCEAEKLTPLHIAARQGNVSAVKPLLKAKVNVDAQNASDDTPLHLAAQAGQKEIIPLLLEAGASHKAENASSKTPIAMASSPDIADWIKKTARQVKQARFVEVETLRELVKEQAKALSREQKRNAELLEQGKKAVTFCFEALRQLDREEIWGCLKTLTGHTSSVDSLAILPNDQLASGARDNSIKIWDLSSGACLKTLTEHTHPVLSLAILPNDHLASGSGDNSIKIWDLSSGACLKTLTGHTHPVLSLAILPNDQLASGARDNSIKIWELSSGACLKTLTGHTHSVNSLAILPDGHLASGSEDNSIKVWNLSSGACLKTLIGHTSCVNSLATLPDGQLASGGLTDNSIKVWDLSRGACLKTLTGPNNVNSLVILPNGCLASGSYSRVKIWSLGLGAKKELETQLEGCKMM